MLTRLTLGSTLCTLAETPEGAPSGVLYAALMTAGVTLSEWQDAVAWMVANGLVTKDGDILRPTAKLAATFADAKQEAARA